MARNNEDEEPGYLVLTGLEYRAADSRRMKVLFCTNNGGSINGCNQATVRAGVRAGSVVRCDSCRGRLRVLSLDEAFDRGVIQLAAFSPYPLDSERMYNDRETVGIDLDRIFWDCFKTKRDALGQRRAESKAAALKLRQDFQRGRDPRRGLRVVS